MANLNLLVEGALAFTFEFLEKNTTDPFTKAKEYIMNKYNLKEECASRFYRPVFWTLFNTLDNHIGSIKYVRNNTEFSMNKTFSAEEMSKLAKSIASKYGDYYKKNAELNGFVLN